MGRAVEALEDRALVLLLTGALNARDKVGLKMNIEETRLEALLKALPPCATHHRQLAHPAGSPSRRSSMKKWCARLSPSSRLGAEGIIEYPLNKVVY